MGIFGQVQPVAIKAKREQGVGGFGTHTGGFHATPERNASLAGRNKYVTYADLAVNVSIVAASLRYFTALVTKSKWSVEAVDDSGEAQRYADLVERAMHDVDQSWSRIIRRASTFRFWGFSLQEWVAIVRPDGVINYRAIEARPQSTVERWGLDADGGIETIVQRHPITGVELFVPRGKLIYLVDDLVTDDPEGLGFLRQCAAPAARLKTFELLEQLGYERDLRGIPVGRVPYGALREWAGNDEARQAQAAKIASTVEQFVAMQMKGQSTGLVLDSQPFAVIDTDGNEKMTTALQFGIELLKGEAPGLADVANAIQRKNTEMARIMGTEGLLLGSDGTGSLALSKDKTTSLMLNVNATINDIVDQFNKDFVDPLWMLNGYPDEYKPKCKAEEASQRDAESIAAVLRDMATAGATLAPDDPVIDDVRDLLGVSKTDPEAVADLVQMQRDALLNTPNDDPIPE